MAGNLHQCHTFSLDGDATSTSLLHIALSDTIFSIQRGGASVCTVDTVLEKSLEFTLELASLGFFISSSHPMGCLGDGSVRGMLMMLVSM